MLAVIDPRPLQAQLEQQIAIRQKDQALLDGAILDMKRYDTLVLKDFATRQQVDQQHALVDQYKAQVVNDEAQIDYARHQLFFNSLHHDPRLTLAVVSAFARSIKAILSAPPTGPPSSPLHS